MLLALLWGCAAGDAQWRLDAEQVRFGWGTLALPVAEGLPYVELFLLGEGELLLQRVPLAQGRPAQVVFDYPWRAGEALWVWGRDAAGARTLLARLRAPQAPAQVQAALQLTAGAPALAGAAPLWLPAGAALQMALAVTKHTPGALQVRVEAWAQPASLLRWQERPPRPGAPGEVGGSANSFPGRGLPGRDDPGRDDPGRAGPAGDPAPRSAWLFLRTQGQVVHLGLPFRLSPRPQAGQLAWRVYSTEGRLLAAGTQALRSVSAAVLQQGLAIREHRFPVPPRRGGGALAAWEAPQAAGRIRLPPPWLRWLGRWGPPRREQQALAALTLHNATPAAAPLAFRSLVRAAGGGPSPAGFAGGPAGPAAPAPLLRVLAPQQAARVELPLRWQAESLAPGRYQRCVEVFFWGLEAPLQTDCQPLQITRSLGAASLALGLLGLACLGAALGFLLRLPAWLGRLELWQAALLALVFALTLLTVSLPGLAFAALTGVLLGPFGFLLDGLLFKGGVFGWAAALMGCLRRPGSFFAFFLLWQLAQAVLHGLISPLLVCSAAVSACLGEAAFWLAGVSRPAAPAGAAGPPRPARLGLLRVRGAPLRPWAGALWIGLAEALALGFYLLLLQSWHRLQLAEWFILLQALSGGGWAALGAWAGLRAVGLQAALLPAAPASPAGAQPTAPPQPAAQPVLQIPALHQPSRAAAATTLPPACLRLQLPPSAEHPSPAAPGAAGAPAGPEALLWPQGFALRCRAGRISVLCGPSGSGKTTLLRLVQGLQPLPQGGWLSLEWPAAQAPQAAPASGPQANAAAQAQGTAGAARTQEAAGAARTQEAAGAAFARLCWGAAAGLRPFFGLAQQAEWQALLETLGRDVDLGATIGRVQGGWPVDAAGEAARQQVQRQALAAFGVSALAARAPQRLSGGELQRGVLAALWAQALASRRPGQPQSSSGSCPEVWLLDEPFAHQDAAGRQCIAAWLAELAAGGAIILLAEHRLAPLEHLPVDRLPLPALPRRHSWAAPAPPPAPAAPHLSAPPAILSRGRQRLPSALAPLRLEGLWLRAPAAWLGAGTATAPAAAGEETWVLQDVCAALAAGQRVVLSGANGAGKTLLLAALAGLQPPARGSIRLAGAILGRLPLAQRRRLVGLVPQQPAASVLAASTIQALVHPLRTRRLSRKEATRQAEAWLHCLGLHQLATTHPQQLSQGELRRLALGRALAQAPLVLLLDEPFAGLDAHAAQRILSLLTRWQNAEPGRRILLSTHDLAWSQHWAHTHWHLDISLTVFRSP